nr:dethiobiotin synthase [uncultured Rhodoferax sp.]
MSALPIGAMPQGAAWFVTGTDTGVGKSLVACALMLHLRARYARISGMKPVAAGSERAPGGEWSNEDVLALQAAATVDLPRALVNPYLLHAPVSPHIAAQRDGVRIELGRIVDACTNQRAQTDALVVEGAGGFRVPLSATQDGADLAVALALPVILVVGLRLGCLNHAVLTAESIGNRGLRLAGWVANHIDPHMPEQQANIDWLQSKLNVPCLADLPHSAAPSAHQMAACFHLPQEFFA